MEFEKDLREDMKTEVFNINRFCNFFAAEFITNIRKNWVSMLVTSLIGVIAVFCFGSIALLVGGEWYSGGFPLRCISAVAFVAILIIVMPSKMYGHVYSPLSGPAYLMIPVSRLERFLSMVLNTAIVVPVLMTCVYLACDALICAMDPNAGKFLLSALATPSADFLAGFSEDGVKEFDFLVSGTSLSFAMLFYLLGALYFKKSKAAKTVLAELVIGWILGLIIIAFVMPFVDTDIELTGTALEFIADNARLFYLLFNFILDAIVLVLIWFRLKNLKL